MSETPFSVRLATQDDLKAICRIYHESHQRGSGLHRLFHRYGWDENRLCGYDFVRQWMGERRNLISVVAVDSGDVVMGFANWTHIEGTEFDKTRRVVDGVEMSKIGRRDGEEPIFANVLREWLKAEDAQLRLWAQEHKSYWYLTLIGVDPAQTNHGIGHKLVSWGKKQAMSCTERAVEVREPVTIMATLESEGHFSRNGFVQCGTPFVNPTYPNIQKIPMQFAGVMKAKDEASLRALDEAIVTAKEGVSEVNVQL